MLKLGRIPSKAFLKSRVDAVLWSLWLARNEKIFDGKITNFKDLIFPMKLVVLFRSRPRRKKKKKKKKQQAGKAMGKNEEAARV
ncbi:hypothetical protein V6N12_070397 [Hibiscus sabdariffa]|uniref:Uncharacterized protein n=1 Tax=Hibiscus sabdariffa TaxID=183260 RepID=A0ABR2FGQ1_9ROSI